MQRTMYLKAGAYYNDCTFYRFFNKREIMTEKKYDAVPPWGVPTHEKMLEVMAGNADAARMMCSIGEWSHIYDDLIDKDKEVTDDKIHWVMWELLVSLQLNPFYTAHSAYLTPLIMSGILNWIAANEIEKVGCLEELRIAHSIRYSICDVGMVAMLLAGGLDHAKRYARLARLSFQCDTWAHYKSEHFKG